MHAWNDLLTYRRGGLVTCGRQFDTQQRGEDRRRDRRGENKAGMRIQRWMDGWREDRGQPARIGEGGGA